MIRLRGRKNESPRIGKPSVPANGAASQVLGQTVSKRHFLKTLLMGAGLAAVAEMGQVGIAPRKAEATYIPGQGGDTVDTHLTVLGSIRSHWYSNEPQIWVERDIGANRYGWYLAVDPGGILALSRAINGTYQAVPIRIEPDATSDVIRLKGSNVGIGTNPLFNLHVKGGGSTYALVDRPASNVEVAFLVRTMGSGVDQWMIGKPASSENFAIGRGFLGNQEFTIATNGNVGIGQTNPQALLHLASTGALKIGNNVIADSGGSYYAQ